MAVQRKRISTESEASKDDLLDRLSNLGQASLREGTADLLSLLDDVESILRSEDLTELERQGFTLIREYPKEATIFELRGLPRTSFMERIREIAFILKKIRALREGGVQIISLNDLIKVGEVDGRPIYSVRRDGGDISLRARKESLVNNPRWSLLPLGCL